MNSPTDLSGTAGVRPHADLPQFYETRSKRAEFVMRLFDDTARYYDRISSVLSFGSCKWYRKMALRRAGLAPGMRLLDVATGTGLAAEAARGSWGIAIYDFKFYDLRAASSQGQNC